MINLQETRDGSYTLYSTYYEASYHSRKGALTESRHVFIRNGIGRYREFHQDRNELRILEMGVGSGLNAFLSAIYASQFKVKIQYTGIDLHPVPTDIALAYVNADIFQELAYSELYSEIIEADWEELHELNPYFSFRKCRGDFLNFHSVEKQDLIFYDAFGPKCQPELWDLKACKHITTLLKRNGVLTTYCAQGQFKRNLRETGFQVYELEGPPGKREMTYAVKMN